MNTNAFKSFKCKAKLLENTAADGNNSILKNAIILPLKKVFFGNHLKCHWLLAKLNWNLDGQSIVF